MTEPLFPRPRCRATTSSALKGIRVLTAGVCLAACGPSIEDSIDKLSAGPDERAMGKHELILANQGVVEPIIAALERRDGNKVRPDLAEVLVARLLRSESKQIWSVLKNHLLDDPDSRVRGRIADKLGLHLRAEYFEVFLQAVSDPSPAVQTPSLHALANVLDQLTDEQTQTLRRLAGERAKAQDQSVREAALYLVEEFVARWAERAREEVLKANLSLADSIYNVALAYAPTSKQANYYLGKFYLENGERERGFQLLRNHRLLIDVTRFASAPRIDGRLDDPIWGDAGSIDSFYTHSGSLTTLPPLAQTNALMGYTDEAMYWGIRCFDAHPESLVVLPFEDKDDSNREQDVVALFFDRNLDRKTFAVILINSEGYIRDGWDDRNKSRQRDHTWDADLTAATYVGEDYWSIELELRWDPKYNPPPASGDISGLDIPRFFRAIEWSQPFRRYRGNDAPGYLVYQ